MLMYPLISIIIPVYNVEKYIENCLNSVINQTYDNLEILLIDDGSTDSSGNICDKYAETDSRIKVIHKENSGVADTRTLGVSRCNGEYYSFIDSDDYIDKEYIRALYEALIEHQADIACCAIAYVYPDGKKFCPLCQDKDDSFVTTSKGIDIIEDILYGRSLYLPSCCLKLYKKSKIGNIVFPKYKIGEDFLASMDFYEKADKVVFINKQYYYYLQNDGSVMHSDDPQKYYDMVMSGEEIYKKAIKIKPALKKAAAHYLMEMNMVVLMKLQNSNHKDKIETVKNNIKKHRKTVIIDKNTKPRIRIGCIVSFFGFRLLFFIRNLTTKQVIK